MLARGKLCLKYGHLSICHYFLGFNTSSIGVISIIKFTIWLLSVPAANYWILITRLWGIIVRVPISIK